MKKTAIFLIWFALMTAQPILSQVEEGELLYLRDPNPRFHGRAVEELQKFLVYSGYDIGRDGVDGWFGKDTEEAVKDYQESNGMARTGRVLYGRFPRDLEWNTSVTLWNEEAVPETSPAQIAVPESETELRTYYGTCELKREGKNGMRYFDYVLSPSGRFLAYRFYHPEMDPSAGMPVYVYDILTEKEKILYPYAAAGTGTAGLAGGAFSDFSWVDDDKLLLQAYLVFSSGSENTVPVLFESLN